MECKIESDVDTLIMNSEQWKSEVAAQRADAGKQGYTRGLGTGALLTVLIIVATVLVWHLCQ